MGLFDHDSFPENEWEDSWETLWNEHDWERYLRKEEDEIRKYQKLYNKLVRSQNRLDEVALFMGWESNSAGDQEETPVESAAEALPEQPYTLHKHPLFIASKALHGWMIEKLAQHAAVCEERIASPDLLRLQASLSESDHFGLLSVSALDMGDFTLAVAYLKRGLSAMNRTLSHFNSIDEKEIDVLSRFTKQARIRLFDLREIWLRVIADCRAAVANQPDED